LDIDVAAVRIVRTRYRPQQSALQAEWWMNQVDKFNGGKNFSMPGRSLIDLISCRLFGGDNAGAN
jgi:hypothetical protein